MKLVIIVALCMLASCIAFPASPLGEDETRSNGAGDGKDPVKIVKRGVGKGSDGDLDILPVSVERRDIPFGDEEPPPPGNDVLVDKLFKRDVDMGLGGNFVPDISNRKKRTPAGYPFGGQPGAGVSAGLREKRSLPGDPFVGPPGAGDSTDLREKRSLLVEGPLGTDISKGLGQKRGVPGMSEPDKPVSVGKRAISFGDDETPVPGSDGGNDFPPIVFKDKRGAPGMSDPDKPVSVGKRAISFGDDEIPVPGSDGGKRVLPVGFREKRRAPRMSDPDKPVSVEKRAISVGDGETPVPGSDGGNDVPPVKILKRDVYEDVEE